eukprot:332658_1
MSLDDNDQTRRRNEYHIRKQEGRFTIVNINTRHKNHIHFGYGQNYLIIFIYLIILCCIFYYPLLLMNIDNYNYKNTNYLVNKTNNYKNIKYSSINCIGKEPNLVCYLKNICYHNQTKNYNDSVAFLYFLDPFLSDTSHEFLKSKIQISHHENRYLRLNIIQNMNNWNDLNNDKILMNLKGTTILHKLYRPGNIGHNLLDDWYPIWYTLSLFNKYDYFSNNLIFYGKTFFMKQQIDKIYNKMFNFENNNSYLILPFFEEDYYLIKTQRFKQENLWLWDVNHWLRNDNFISPNIIAYNGHKMSEINDIKYICFEEIFIGSHVFNQHWPNKQFHF